ncbi:MAG: hypothetical protein GXP21_08500 [Gammaproteobacteria bacterium]|nr:hypothetical protein [Gammaproteobacteria bacterium]
MNFDDIREEIKSRGIDPENYESAYNDLLARVENTIITTPREDSGDLQAIGEYALVLRQVLLHRAIKLFEGSVNALINDNGYSMVLSIRGHFETTAAVGYLHNRLASLGQGNLTPDVVDKDIVTQLLGTRDATILESASKKFDVAEAKQVLNMLEYADKSFSKHILGGTANECTMLMERYKWLCEFSHPNFHSNTLAFTLDKEKQEFNFSYDSKLSVKEAKLIESILISSPIFKELYDRIETLLPNR